MEDLAAVPDPGDGDERSVLLGWLDAHRHALEVACAGLTDEQLAVRPLQGAPLSLLGIVRHLAEMERVHGVWANGCPCELVHVWESAGAGGLEDDPGCASSEVSRSMRAWRDEKASTDGMVESLALDDDRGANGRTVRWNLHKLLDEYARNHGRADLVRSRIDARAGAVAPSGAGE
jgi:hypothetical protein